MADGSTSYDQARADHEAALDKIQGKLRRDTTSVASVKEVAKPPEEVLDEVLNDVLGKKHEDGADVFVRSKDAVSKSGDIWKKVLSSKDDSHGQAWGNALSDIAGGTFRGFDDVKRETDSTVLLAALLKDPNVGGRFQNTAEKLRLLKQSISADGLRDVVAGTRPGLNEAKLQARAQVRGQLSSRIDQALTSK